MNKEWECESGGGDEFKIEKDNDGFITITIVNDDGKDSGISHEPLMIATEFTFEEHQFAAFKKWIEENTGEQNQKTLEEQILECCSMDEVDTDVLSFLIGEQIVAAKSAGKTRADNPYKDPDKFPDFNKSPTLKKLLVASMEDVWENYWDNEEEE